MKDQCIDCLYKKLLNEVVFHVKMPEEQRKSIKKVFQKTVIIEDKKKMKRMKQNENN